MVLRLTEGNLAPVSCLDDEVNQCARSKDCMTLYVWEKLYKAINDTVDNITIEDILKHSESLNREK
jgi:DNA-binding IscR family transcriptional regulator